MKTSEFDEIRPYQDEELAGVFEELIADPLFRQAITTGLPQIPFDAFAAKMRACKTTLEFQKALPYPIIWDLAHKTTDGLTFDISAIGDRSKAYTYVSNHRDIILDSGFLCILLFDQGLDTVEIAIGDNLLVYPWIEKMVRINKSFIVRRGLSMRQMLESSTLMSRYMHYTICEKKQSIWIAQREGRAKDADDRTQESVLKMLAMGHKGDTLESLMEMNIMPLTASYEYDPCDYLKAREFQQKRDDPNFTKTVEDDLFNMKTGLTGYKGKVHLQVAGCLNGKLAAIDHSTAKKDLFGKVAALLDREIHHNYRIYPGNYIAYDLLDGSGRFEPQYSLEERKRFRQYIHGQLGKIELPNKDVPFLYGKLLEMYANPLKNYLKTV